MAAVSTKTRGIVEKTALLSKFRGALVGAVVGDCLGAHFEGDWDVNIDQVLKFFGILKENVAGCGEDESPELHRFTDDTAMARSVAHSLLHHKAVNTRDMASRFVSEFFKEPYRGYGGNVVTVFKLLREADCCDPHGPAGMQFGGSGSYGNGGAMRIVPAALFGLKYTEEKLNGLVADITRITHTHHEGLIGAKLQCRAVQLALQMHHSNDEAADATSILHKLQLQAKLLEGVSVKQKTLAASESIQSEDSDSPPAKKKAPSSPSPPPSPDNPTYSSKLALVEEFLSRHADVIPEEVAEKLGNDVSALGSVPAAIWSFVRCTRTHTQIMTDSAFERTILYAISLGGDTDTIATMAGAIAGAYYGLESIPALWRGCCEGVDTAMEQAEELLAIVEKAECASSPVTKISGTEVSDS